MTRRRMAPPGLTIAAALALTAGYLLAGPVGLVTATVVCGLLGLLAAWSRLPRPPARRRARRARRTRTTTVTTAEFPAYRDIGNRLRWAHTSRRRFDIMVRPMLTPLLAAALADRHRVDLAAAPEAARALVDERVWELLDPARPDEHGSSAPGVEIGTIELIIDTLEGL